MGESYKCALSVPKKGIFMDLYGLLPLSRKMETKRIGGSNGLAVVDESLFVTMHNPGGSPRLGIGRMWTLAGCVLGQSYCTPYETTRRFTSGVPLTPAKAGGALLITKNKFKKLKENTRKWIWLCVYVKAISVNTIAFLNAKSRTSTRNYFISRHSWITQSVTNWLACFYSGFHGGLQGKEQLWYEFLVTSCNFTILASAVDFHFDTPKRHPFSVEKTRKDMLDMLGTTKEMITAIKWLGSSRAFPEPKQAFVIDRDENIPPSFGEIGRGGGGSNVCVGMVLDHSVTAQDVNWQEGPPMPQGLINALGQAARDMGLGSLLA